MKLFSTLHDSDIFDDPVIEPIEYKVRPTAKGFVFDNEGNIALLSVRDHYGLPGGGVESEETFEEAFIRECKEEMGCVVEILSPVGTAEQYRAEDAKKYELTYFTAKVVGEKSIPTSTQDDESGIVVVWFSKEKTKQVLEQQLYTIPENDYPAQFNLRTHLAAYNEAVSKGLL